MASLPVETHPWIDAKTPLLRSLKSTRRVRGSRTVSTVARSALSRVRAAREEEEPEAEAEEALLECPPWPWPPPPPWPLPPPTLSS